MTYPISTPVARGTDNHGFAWKAVTVMSVDTKTRMARCVDNFGKFLDVRCDILRAKGNLPEKGEQWIIDRNFGVWMFSAIINGTTAGVEVSNVTGLPHEIQRIDTATREVNAASLDRDNAQTAATTGKILAKGDLLAGTGQGIVDRQAVGSLNQALVADPSTATGLVYRDVCGRPVGYSGLTGATAAGRWVGCTTSGAPTSGTWAVGDWVSTQTGYRWVCTVAGTPGTWVERTSALEGRTTTVENRVTALETLPPRSQIISRSYINSSTAAVGNQALSTGGGAIRTFGAVKAGRLYRIGTDNLQVACDNAPVRCNIGLRYSVDGTNTNSGGFLIQQTGVFLNNATNSTNGNRPEGTALRAFFVPNQDCILSTSIVISSGSTISGVYPNVWIYANPQNGVDNYIEDLGPDPGA